MGTGIIAIAAGIAMGCAALGIGSKAMESMGKQPEAAGSVRTALIVAMAIMETIGVLTFVIAIVLAGKI